MKFRCYLILFIFLPKLYAYSSVILSEKEKIQVESIFIQLFKDEPLAYTLYFDKPMSFFEGFYRDLHSFSNSPIEIEEYLFIKLRWRRLPDSTLRKAWETFEGHPSLVNKDKYLFVKRNYGENEFIFLINKEAFKATVNRYIKLFKERLGKETSADLLLKQIEDKDSNIKEILKDNQILLGILLGFGKQNAKLFDLRHQLYVKIASMDYVQKYQNILKTQKKIDHLDSILQCRNDYYTSILHVRHVAGYACDRNHPESQALEKKYVEQAKFITEILSRENWMDEILQKLRS